MRLPLVTSLVCFSSVFANNVTWNGSPTAGSGNDWSQITNWTPQQEPSSGTAAYFPTNAQTGTVYLTAPTNNAQALLFNGSSYFLGTLSSIITPIITLGTVDGIKMSATSSATVSIFNTYIISEPSGITSNGSIYIDSSSKIGFNNSRFYPSTSGSPSYQIYGGGVLELRNQSQVAGNAASLSLSNVTINSPALGSSDSSLFGMNFGTATGSGSLTLTNQCGQMLTNGSTAFFEGTLTSINLGTTSGNSSIVGKFYSNLNQFSGSGSLVMTNQLSNMLTDTVLINLTGNGSISNRGTTIKDRTYLAKWATGSNEVFRGTGSFTISNSIGEMLTGGSECYFNGTLFVDNNGGSGVVRGKFGSDLYLFSGPSNLVMNNVNSSMLTSTDNINLLGNGSITNRGTVIKDKSYLANWANTFEVFTGTGSYTITNDIGTMLSFGSECFLNGTINLINKGPSAGIYGSLGVGLYQFSGSGSMVMSNTNSNMFGGVNLLNLYGSASITNSGTAFKGQSYLANWGLSVDTFYGTGSFAISNSNGLMLSSGTECLFSGTLSVKNSCSVSSLFDRPAGLFATNLYQFSGSGSLEMSNENASMLTSTRNINLFGNASLANSGTVIKNNLITAGWGSGFDNFTGTGSFTITNNLGVMLSNGTDCSFSGSLSVNNIGIASELSQMLFFGSNLYQFNGSGSLILNNQSANMLNSVSNLSLSGSTTINNIGGDLGPTANFAYTSNVDAKGHFTIRNTNGALFSDGTVQLSPSSFTMTSRGTITPNYNSYVQSTFCTDVKPGYFNFPPSSYLYLENTTAFSGYGSGSFTNSQVILRGGLSNVGNGKLDIFSFFGNGLNLSFDASELDLQGYYVSPGTMTLNNSSVTLSGYFDQNNNYTHCDLGLNTKLLTISGNTKILNRYGTISGVEKMIAKDSVQIINEGTVFNGVKYPAAFAL